MATAMNQSIPVSATAEVSGGRYLEWSPIVVGTLGTLAILTVLMTFGAALGLSVTSAQPYAGMSAKAVGLLGGAYAVIAHVLSFCAGGYLAGRMRTPWVTSDAGESQFRDGGYGFAVWALGVVLAAVLATSGVAGVVRSAVSATSTVAAAGVAGAAANSALPQVSMAPVDYAVDRILAPGASGAPASTQGAPAQSPASRTELAPSVARIFAATSGNAQLPQADKATLAAMVSSRTGLAQADAEKRVDEAFAELKAAEQKARDAADAARRAALIAAFAVAATLAVACGAACFGSSLGGRHRDERTTLAVFGAKRFW